MLVGIKLVKGDKLFYLPFNMYLNLNILNFCSLNNYFSLQELPAFRHFSEKIFCLYLIYQDVEILGISIFNFVVWIIILHFRNFLFSKRYGLRCQEIFRRKILFIFNIFNDEHLVEGQLVHPFLLVPHQSPPSCERSCA